MMIFSMDPRLREGIRLFNTGRFFDSHESLEELYREAPEQDKPFIEGLIELAAACRLYCDFSETRGPARMVRHALIRLEHYEPHYLGIKVKRLIAAMEAWAQDITADAHAGPALAAIPKIRRRFFL